MRAPRAAAVKVLIVTLGIGLALAQSALAWDRGAAPTEVFAPLLYIPVFAGAVLFGLPGGLVAAAGSSVIYLLVLIDQSSALGTRLFVGLFVNRAVTFLVYGVLVSLGTRYIEDRLRKLELYDHIDDQTKLFNSAFFLEDSDLEMSRSRRYRSIFSVAEVRLDPALFAGTPRRTHRRLLSDLGGQLQRAVRAMDRPARVVDDGAERFLVILPETGFEGSSVLATRLEAGVRTILEHHDVTANGGVSARALTYPDDQEAVEALRREIAEADARRRVLAVEDGGRP